MAAARMRALAARLNSILFAKRSISFYKAKSGLIVPEGYENNSKFDDVKGFFRKGWYGVDESARVVIIQSGTKYLLATLSDGGSLILYNRLRERLSKLETQVNATNKELKETKEAMKAEVKRTEDQ
ncbi:unnamed protein product, partial [Urochloa humidicola]